MVDLMAWIARAVGDDSRQAIVEAMGCNGGASMRVWIAQSEVGKMTGQQRRIVGAVRAILAA
jgi:predicted RNA-binding protein YlqC (UPF0109 family)